MDPFVAIIALLLLAAVILVVSAPLRHAGRPADADPAGEGAGEPAGAVRETHRSPSALLDRDELEAAREAKYREIRDAEMDYRTGKLSKEDYEAIDGELRMEAIAILDRIERLTGKSREPELTVTGEPGTGLTEKPPGTGPTEKPGRRGIKPPPGKTRLRGPKRT